jgi:ABC-type Fe3+/spermidine/putrescine transport system ATPase subunit
MENGRIVQLGAPNDIYYRPTSRFVASFIGHANFITGEVSQVSGNRCELSVGGLTFKGVATAPLRVGAQATGVLRYEHVRIVAGRDGKGFAATIEDVSFQGSTYRVVIKLTNGSRIISEMTGSSAETPFSKDDAISVDWADDNFTILPD